MSLKLVLKLESNISAHIVAWALPKEEIPLTVKWKDHIEFSKIEIAIPPDLEFKEVINVEEFEIKANTLEIYSIKEIEGAPYYFGCIVSSKIIYNELKISRDIIIKYYKDTDIIHVINLNARIFRPLLEVLDPPTKLIFNKQNDNNLPLVLKFTGFGDILINITGRINGKLVTKGKSFLYEVIKRIIEMGDKDKSDYGEIYVSPEFILNTKKEILIMLENPPEDILDTIEELRSSINGEKFTETIEELIEKRIEDVILGMIFDLIKKNPVNNVKLSDGEISVSTVLEAPMETLELFIKYKDIIGNEYPEIKIPIELKIDKFKDSKMTINIPIIIERWEHEPFKNVREMKIEKS